MRQLTGERRETRRLRQLNDGLEKQVEALQMDKERVVKELQLAQAMQVSEEVRLQEKKNDEEFHARMIREASPPCTLTMHPHHVYYHA